MATPDQIQAVRYELNDNTPGLYILDDDTVSYFIDKNNGSIARASLDAAKTILFKLSIESTDEVVSVLSLKGSKAAEQYRLALELYVKSPSLNPLYSNATLWAGNVSRSEMQTNNSTCDNNIPSLATQDLNPSCYSSDSNPFSI